MQHETWDLAVHSLASVESLASFSCSIHESHRRGKGKDLPASPIRVALALGQEAPFVKGLQRLVTSSGMVSVFWCLWGWVKEWLANGCGQSFSQGPFTYILVLFDLLFLLMTWGTLKKTSLHYSFISVTRIHFHQFCKEPFSQLGLASGFSLERHQQRFLVVSPDKLCGRWSDLISNICH